MATGMLNLYLSHFRGNSINVINRLPRWRSGVVRWSSSTSRWNKQTHYQVLGVPVNASTTEIRSAFVSLSKQIHPDCNPTDPDNHSKFVRLNEAYNVLIREQSREEYDMSIGLRDVGLQYPSYHATSRSTSRYTQSDGVGYEGEEFRAAGHAYTTGPSAEPKVPNYVVAAACGGIVLLGFLYFFIGYQYTIIRQRSRLDALDRRNAELLRESQENARRNGSRRQLEILVEKQAERRRSIEAAAAAAAAGENGDK